LTSSVTASETPPKIKTLYFVPSVLFSLRNTHPPTPSLRSFIFPTFHRLVDPRSPSPNLNPFTFRDSVGFGSISAVRLLGTA
ncbi:hypothetical protein MJO28_010908, partial [Puccinia striiformis f. sp. tritici]